MSTSADQLALRIRSGFNRFKREQSKHAPTLVERVEEQSRAWADGKGGGAIESLRRRVERSAEVEQERDVVESTSRFALMVADVIRQGAEAEPEVEQQEEPRETTVEVTEVESTADVEETLPAPLPPVRTQQTPAPAQDSMVTSSTSAQQTPRTEEIVDKLFGKMQGLFDDKAILRERDLQRYNEQSAAKSVQISEESQKLMLVESRNEMAKIVRAEVPKLITTELSKAVRKEMLSLFRAEVAKTLKEEFSTVQRLLTSMADRIGALEPRLAKMEGAVGREIMVKFPKGGINVDVPITIPEREVKIAAPINVQPPNVVFNEEAISVNFHKGQQNSKRGKKVKFNRDAYDNIVDAEIVSD